MTTAYSAGYSSYSHWKHGVLPTYQFLIKGYKWLTLYVNSHLKNSKQRDFFPVPYGAPLHGRKWTITTIPDTQHTLQLLSSPVTMLPVFFSGVTAHTQQTALHSLLWPWHGPALLWSALPGVEMSLHLLIHSQFYRCTNISLPNQGVNHLHSNAAGHLFAALNWHSHSFLTKYFIDLLNFAKWTPLLKNVT